jgi:hypothetical protein
MLDAKILGELYDNEKNISGEEGEEKVENARGDGERIDLGVIKSR